MNRKVLAAPVLGAALLALAACNGHPSVRAVASPTSSQVKAAEADATKVVTRCQPKGQTTTAWETSFILHPAVTTKAFLGCEKITDPKKKSAAVSCSLGVLKTAVRTVGSARRETVLLNGLTTCVQAAQK